MLTGFDTLIFKTFPRGGHRPFIRPLGEITRRALATAGGIRRSDGFAVIRAKTLHIFKKVVCLMVYFPLLR